MCGNCYKQLAEREGRKIAQNKRKKVNIFCDNSDGKPFIYVPCVF